MTLSIVVRNLLLNLQIVVMTKNKILNRLDFLSIDEIVGAYDELALYTRSLTKYSFEVEHYIHYGDILNDFYLNIMTASTTRSICVGYIKKSLRNLIIKNIRDNVKYRDRLEYSIGSDIIVSDVEDESDTIEDILAYEFKYEKLLTNLRSILGDLSTSDRLLIHYDSMLSVNKISELSGIPEHRLISKTKALRLEIKHKLENYG